MIIALYDNHHHLPFWHKPKNPTRLFQNGLLNEYKCENDEAFSGKIRACLAGLDALDAPGLMAHMSLSVDEEARTMGNNKRIWVQITTKPAMNNEMGVPIILSPNGEVEVDHVWGGDNGTRSPIELIPVEVREEIECLSMDYWKYFFEEMLGKAKRSLEDEMIYLELEIATRKKLLEAMS